jgi:sugar lactone lactonase YvrE
MTSRIRGILRTWSAFALPVVFITLAGCSADGAGVTDAQVDALGAQFSVAPGPITTVARFDVFAAQLPESIAVDRYGNIYVAMALLGEIWKLDPSGTFQEVVASFPTAGLFGLMGLRFDARGDLYAANSADDQDARGVWKISPTGERERIAGTRTIPLPNDVAISPDGTLYITDSATGAVWRSVRGAAAEIWVQDPTLEGTGAFGLPVPIGANGIVVIPGRGSAGGVVVANTEKGQLVHVPILQDGRAGQPTVVVSDPASLFGLDGIAVDARGTIYGAVNAGNKVVRISSDGADVSEVLSGEPLDFPAALAFGTGLERHTLFVVNFSLIHFFNDPPTLDEANPAVIAVPVGAPGAGSP